MPTIKKRPEDGTVWEKRYQEFKASGKSQAAWCKEKSVNPNTFNFWYLRLKAEEPNPPAPKRTKKEAVKWLTINTNEIQIKQKATNAPTCAVDIKIANVTIEVKPGFEPEHLLNVIKTLRELC